MSKRNKTESQAPSIYQLVPTVGEMTDPAQSSIQSLPQEQEIIVEKDFPPELLTVNQKALQRFMSRFEGYNYDNCKMYITGNVIQEAFAYYSPNIINVDETGIDFRGKISNLSQQLKVTREIKKNRIKGFKLKNKQGEGNNTIIYADYYVFLEQFTGRGACVPRNRITNIRQQNSDTIADVYFEPDDFWMQPYNIKNEHLNPDGEIVMSDDFWKDFQIFKHRQFDECL